MADEGAPDVGLGTYLSVLARRWLIIVASAITGLVAAGAYVVVVPPSYIATSEVSINVITADPFNSSRAASGLLDIPGEAKVAGSHAVAERAAAALSEVTAQQVRQAVEVTGSPESTTLRITATAGTPDSARRVADVVAQEYLNFRSLQSEERIARTVESARERLDEQRADLLAATTRLAAAESGSAEAIQAETDRSLLNLEISSILDELTSAQSIDTAGGTILNPAAAASVVRRPSPELILSTGLLAGLALGLLLAFVRDMLDRRVRTGADVRDVGAGPFVVELPARSDSIPPAHEDLDQLLNLREHLFDRPEMMGRRGVLSIVDFSHGAGARQFPLALAMMLARSGAKVCFLALAGDRSVLHEAADTLDLRPGTSHGRYSSHAATAVPGLTIVVATDHSTEQSEEPLAQPLRALIEETREENLIVLSVPPGSSQATRYAGMRLADLVVLVAGVRRTPRAELQQAAAELRGLGIGLLGTVVVGHRRTGGNPSRGV